MWQPPTSLLDGLTLPGRNPEVVDKARLNRLIRDHQRSLSTTAAQLGATVDIVRRLLETHPAPAPSPARPDQARVYSGAYRTAKSALLRHRFIDLYQRDRLGLRDIAASIAPKMSRAGGQSEQGQARADHADRGPLN